MGATRFKARPRRSAIRGLERLEDRLVPTTFTVTNLAATGAGSLRQAMLDANATPGADTIAFGLGGTIKLGSLGLPALTDTVAIDASSWTGGGGPRVTVDFNGTAGFRFAAGSDGSVLRSLSVVRANGAGVTLDASHITIQGNYIGLAADGSTVQGNRGDGIRVNASSSNNLIGDTNTLTGIDFYPSSGQGDPAVDVWRGISTSLTPGQVYMTGASGSRGVLYFGPVSGGGTYYTVEIPGGTSTILEGAQDLGGGVIRVVATSGNGGGSARGYIFQGTTSDLADPSHYAPLNYAGATLTDPRSIAGNLTVGNAGGPDLPTNVAFAYDIQDDVMRTVSYPGAPQTFATGVWANGGTAYTIVGYYDIPGSPSEGAYRGFVVDFDTSTGEFTHWTSFDHPVDRPGQVFSTQFQGVSSPLQGIYTIAARSRYGSTDVDQVGSLVTLRRAADGSFIADGVKWVDLDSMNATPRHLPYGTAGDQLAGVNVLGAGGGFQAIVNSGYHVSNVISGNGGNGIGLYGSNGNRIAMNQIGTDVSGNRARGNAGNGILITAGASDNYLGGDETGGNNPTQKVIVRPPQGNQISANGGAGVLMNQGAARNLLSGNFIGTDAAGTAALGNKSDGVRIVDGVDNALVGCNFVNNPFIYYNVVSGNGGNGVYVYNSSGTIIQANFLGAGADNRTVVANQGDGLLVAGNSSSTLVGGKIPLGNVISGNNRHGIEVRDQVSGFTTFNTFGGTFAFGGAAPNKGDGMRITASGADNLVLVSLFSGNKGSGLSIGGNARGVKVINSTIGTDITTQVAIPNQGDGISLWGNARDTLIGGPVPTNLPPGSSRADGQLVIDSNNLGYGLAIRDRVRDTVVIGSTFGTDATLTLDRGNVKGGIFLGAGTSGTKISGPSAVDAVLVSYSKGNGLDIRSSKGNRINAIRIVDNRGVGLYAAGNCSDTTVVASDIQRNLGGNVDISKATGVTIIDG